MICRRHKIDWSPHAETRSLQRFGHFVPTPERLIRQMADEMTEGGVWIVHCRGVAYACRRNRNSTEIITVYPSKKTKGIRARQTAE